MTRYVFERGEVQIGDDGQAIRMLGTTQDVTDQREYIEAIKATQMQLLAAPHRTRGTRRLRHSQRPANSDD